MSRGVSGEDLERSINKVYLLVVATIVRLTSPLVKAGHGMTALTLPGGTNPLSGDWLPQSKDAVTIFPAISDPAVKALDYR